MLWRIIKIFNIFRFLDNMEEKAVVSDDFLKTESIKEINKNEPLIAYRVWSLNTEEATIGSYGHSHDIWPKGQIMKTDEVPTSSNDNGLHAWKTMNHALQYAGSSPNIVIIGTIYLWGKIVEHERGYRAEFAYPKKLEILAGRFYDINRTQIETNLRNSYGCEVDLCFNGEKIFETTIVNFENYIPSYQTLDKVGTKYWYKDGLYHRDDGPTMEYKQGRKTWHQNGKLHRIDGPAIIYANGVREWYHDGRKISKEVTHEDGSIRFKNDKNELHFTNGPAVILPNGRGELWYENGQLHRIDGPAVTIDGIEEWWLFGVRHKN